jgi:hypothetical protein
MTYQYMFCGFRLTFIFSETGTVAVLPQPKSSTFVIFASKSDNIYCEEICPNRSNKGVVWMCTTCWT